MIESSSEKCEIIGEHRVVCKLSYTAGEGAARNNGVIFKRCVFIKCMSLRPGDAERMDAVLPHHSSFLDEYENW